ncbi:chemotaxis protein [Leptospira wolffii]|uniref:methyl-accepting chemotaxis protein n=1 Tax=Leptospira wolffii TaxID=409998 RepID=UPI001083F6CE|nr:methyl-accepting chemotaxis protein [Leptospira wolffii]TGL44055.1 chemotaxis protein [Leptospira wolffii]
MKSSLELERQGEVAANYLRFFLIAVFVFGTILGYVLKTGIQDLLGYYSAGILVYSFVTILSISVMRFYGYKAWLKYATVLLEFLGYAIVQLGYFWAEDHWKPNGILSPANYGIYFLILSGTIFRFNPRFTFICSVILSVQFVVMAEALYLLNPQLASLGSSGMIQLRGSLILLMGVFLFAFGVTISYATKFVRRLVEEAQDAEDRALKNYSLAKAVLQSSEAVAEELRGSLSGVEEAAIANEDTSRELASMVEETSATLEQMGASIESIAKMAETQDEFGEDTSLTIERWKEQTTRVFEAVSFARSLGEGSASTAIEGEGTVRIALDVFSQFKNTVQEVSKILGVIQDLSGKTNLLSLNAAIEAARAGELGKGFSVVAEEVSKLADSSSRNAKEIVKQIGALGEASQTSSEKFAELVQAFRELTAGIGSIGEALAQVSDSVNQQKVLYSEVEGKNREIRSLSKEMKNATLEQANGTRQILEGIEYLSRRSMEMSEITEKLRAGLERLKASSVSLSDTLESNRLE